MKVLVTGGAGFIGSNFILRLLFSGRNYEVVCMDSLTYAGDIKNLDAVVSKKGFEFKMGDIGVLGDLAKIVDGSFDVVVNFANESHVDRSIDAPHLFLDTNVMGTHLLLNRAMTAGIERFIHISTDEVYGSMGDGEFATEESRTMPSSPYAASKASADHIIRAYGVTYGYKSILVRPCNCYGPRQHPEKLIPKAIINLMRGQKVPIYGDGKNKRTWMYMEDCCAGIEAIMRAGRPGEIYNLGTEEVVTNIKLVGNLMVIMGFDYDQCEFVRDRPGHDRRYAVNSTKVRAELGWSSPVGLDAGLRSTVQWYKKEEAWWKEKVRRQGMVRQGSPGDRPS